jgi:hypothetical protein
LKCPKLALVESCTIMLGVYNASLGRFLNRDPLGEAGDINLYDYVNNNPIAITDPLGLKGVPGGDAVSTATTVVEDIISGSKLVPAPVPGLNVIYVELSVVVCAIIEHAKDMEQLAKGKKCDDDFKKDLDDCKHKVCPKNRDPQHFKDECEYEALEKFLKCLADAGFNVADVFRDAQWFQDYSDWKQQQQQNAIKEVDDLQQRMREIWLP